MIDPHRVVQLVSSNAVVLLEAGIQKFLDVVERSGSHHVIGGGNQLVKEPHGDAAQDQAEKQGRPDDFEDVDPGRFEGEDFVIMRQPAVDHAGGK